MPRHLVLGASGQIGEQLMNSLPDAAGTFFSVPRPGLEILDIRDRAATEALIFKISPRTIFVPAFSASVDRCETDPQGTRAVNTAPVPVILSAAEKIKARIVYFSSDYVFDGRNGPYCENDAPNPINEYGRQKLAAEGLILAAGAHLVLRTTVVYGPETQGKNFVLRLAKALSERTRVQVPVDQIGSPSYAPDIASAAIELADSAASGIFHVCGPDLVSRFDFARATAAAFGYDASLIEPVETSVLAQNAARPLRAGMKTNKLRAAVKTALRGYLEGLRLTAAASKFSR